MKVCIIGYGAVGQALTDGLHRAGVEIKGIVDTSIARQETVNKILFPLVSLDEIPLEVDIIVLTIPDREIRECAQQLALVISKKLDSGKILIAKPVVTHFSGRFGVEVLEPLKGIVDLAATHPAQSFTLGDNGSKFEGIYFGVTYDSNAERIISEMISLLKAEQVLIPDDGRAAYHHSCVLVSNFLPLMMDTGIERLKSTGINDREAKNLLYPLLKGMVGNLEHKDPGSSITGPIVRNDFDAITMHLDNWNDIDARELYLKMSASLAKLAYKAGRISGGDTENWFELLNNLREKKSE